MTPDAVPDLRDGSDASAEEKRLKRYRSAAFTEEYLASCLGSGTVPRASSSRMISSPEKSVEERAVVPTLEAPEPVNKKHATSSTLLRSQDDHNIDYQCSFCGEAFLNYQALSGHKTIHRAEFSTVTDTVTDPDEASAASSTSNAPTPNVSAPSKSNPRDKAAHVCSICHRSFRKGQSLGGHMRRHYKGRIRPRAKTTVPNTITFFPSSEDGVCIKKHHHDFDLNLSPPPPEPAEHELDLELRLNF